jgi:hypothetical protein
MSIHFICTCGKRLKARDEMAARRSICPSCGRPVGIPSGQASQRGAPTGPLSPHERRQRAWSGALHSRVAADDVPTVIIPFTNDPLKDSAATGHSPPGYRVVEQPIADDESACYRLGKLQGADAVQRWRQSEIVTRKARKEMQRRRRERRLPVETRWYQCLIVPCLTVRWELSLALALALATLFAFLIGWPAVADAPEWPVIFGMASVALLPIVAVCAYLQCVLRTAVVGAPPSVFWPEARLDRIIWGTFRWLTCVLVGPFALTLVGLYYWIWCGDLDLLDWLILGELSFAAAAYVLFAVLNVTRSRRVWDANPLAVALLVRALGPRTGAFALTAWLLVLVHFWWGSVLILNVADGPGGAIYAAICLALCWFSLLCCMTFVLRLLGLWSFHRLGAPAEVTRA